MRARAKDRAALHKLIVDLRGIALSAKPPVKPVTTMSIDKPPQKAQRTIQKRTTPQSALEHTVPLSQTPSKESDAPSGKGKQKKKKKKRSVLANQGNPHHVDNCENCSISSSARAYARSACSQGISPVGPIRTLPSSRFSPLPTTDAPSCDWASTKDSPLARRRPHISPLSSGRGRLCLLFLRNRPVLRFGKHAKACNQTDEGGKASQGEHQEQGEGRRRGERDVEG